jgi:hypothetical protein
MITKGVAERARLYSEIGVYITASRHCRQGSSTVGGGDRGRLGSR